ncbi:MAG: glycine zipper 2TM domain-containing protein [Gammaproteobacteria bacterium]|nr:glycine zipper 2TM domain-containing protein [Gammaproteobacteria bacterium]
MKALNLLVIASACVVVLAGCAASQSGSAYSRTQTRQAQDVEMGVVESVREVQIEGTKTPIGAGAGAVVGGVAGSTVGGGKGSTVAAVLGAVGGGLAGAAIEEGVTRKKGLEITVRLDSGKMIAVTQEADEAFAPGERVRILSGGGVVRVSH